MNYQVIWKPEAERRLANIWLDSAKRQAVTDAARMIDQRLAHDPRSQGESRDAGRRVLYVPPLAVIFKVNSKSKKVRVLTVWENP
jgi:hypothetical protein